MEIDLARLDAVAKLTESLSAKFPDAKKLHIRIQWEWQVSENMGSDAEELVPQVDINIER